MSDQPRAAVPRITIVEDEPSILRLYQTKLTMEGYTVSVASNGADGFAMMRANPPDLLMLDLRMPGMQGDELLAKVREQDWGSSIRVIILTNLSRGEAPASLRFLAVDRYVIKAHHTPSQITDIVREVLRIR